MEHLRENVKVKESVQRLLRRLVGLWELFLDVRGHPDLMNRAYHIQGVREAADEVIAFGYNKVTNGPVDIYFAPTSTGPEYLFVMSDMVEVSSGSMTHLYFFNQREHTISGEFTIWAEEEDKMVMSGTFMGRRSEKDTPA